MDRPNSDLYHEFKTRLGMDLWHQMFQALSKVAFGSVNFFDAYSTQTELNTPCDIGNFHFEFFSFDTGSYVQRPHTAAGYYEDGNIGFAFVIKKSEGMREILALKIRSNK